MTVHRRCPRCEGGPMHVGLAAVFQNPKKARSDIDVYRNELRLAAEAEPLGFESVWGVEHHFTDYTMCPDVLQFVRQPRAAIRPAPFKTFRGRTYAAAVSPESMPIMARLGVGILVIPQKPWPEVAKELDAYRTTYRDINRTEAPPPVCAGWTFCDENPARAHEMARRYIGGYYQTVLDHYNFQGDHLAKTKGYEYYGKMAEKIAQYGTDKVIEYFMNLQVWGTPEQCYEKILDVRGRVGNDTFVGVFSYAGMDYGEAERHMRLFARTVTPELKKLPPAAAPAPAAAAPRAGKELGVGLLGS